MDSTAEYPQSEEIERVPSLRIGFLGSGAGFLRVKLEDPMGQYGTFSAYDLSYPDFKQRIKQLQEANQNIRVVITDRILSNDAKWLNRQGIAIIFLDQTHRDHSYLTSEDPNRKVKNEVITVKSIDAESMATLLPKVAQAIENLTQPK